MSNKITVIIFAVLMLGLSAFAVLKPRTEYSESERRKLTAFPKFTLSSFESGSFAKNFETASLDQFPLRDKFRTVKALAQYKLFGFSDNNGIYITNGYAAKQLYPLNEASVKNAAQGLLPCKEQRASRPRLREAKRNSAAERPCGRLC